jgi:hypothetical protein
MDPEDWTMGSLAAQDGYAAMPVSGNVIDRRSFVPAQPFEQPSDEETFLYELRKKMLGNEPLGRGPPMEDEPMLPGEGMGVPPAPLNLEPMPEPTGDDELDDARGGLRPMTREELDQFEAQMQASRDGSPMMDMASMGKMSRERDPWGMRESVANRIEADKLAYLGMAPPYGGMGSIMRPSTPQANFDAYLDQRRGFEPEGLSERIHPNYPMDDLDVRRGRR